MPPSVLRAVVESLMSAGHQDLAREFASAVRDRDPSDTECAAALERFSTTHPVALDLTLADSFIRQGWFREARAILYAGGARRDPASRQRIAWIDEVFELPPRETDAGVAEAHSALSRGGAFTLLAALDDLTESDTPGTRSLTAWETRIRSVLERLLLDTLLPPHDGGSVAAHDPLSFVARTDVNLREAAMKIAVRQLLDARAALGRAHGVGVLETECAAFERVLERMASSRSPDAADVSTARMSERDTAELFLTMGNVGQAERHARRAVFKAPDDPSLRTLLADIRTVREYLEPPHEATSQTALKRLTGVLAPGAAAGRARDDNTKPVQLPESDDMEFDDVTAVAKRGAVPREPGPPPAQVAARSEAIDTKSLAAPASRASQDTIGNTAPARGGQSVRPPAASTLPDHTPSRSEKSASSVAIKRERTATVDPAYRRKAHPHPSLSEEADELTSVVSHEERAELLLRQGYVDKALSLFRDLARGPGGARYDKRIKEIESRAVDRDSDTTNAMRLPESKGVITVAKATSAADVASLPTGEGVLVSRIIRVT